MNAGNTAVVTTDRTWSRRGLLAALRGWARHLDKDGRSIAVQTDRNRWAVDLSLGCPRPHKRRVVGSNTLSGQKYAGGLLVDFRYPCRRQSCGACMTNRARQWGARACVEYRRHARTWLVTFTMSPLQHTVLEANAMKRWRDKYHAEMAPTSDVGLKLQCQDFQQHVKRWLDRAKKARKRAGGNIDGALKYFLVAEVHNSEKTSEFMRGRPHFHMLLHEKEIGTLISDEECEWAGTPQRPYYRVRSGSHLREAWQFGLTELKLATDEESVYYLCKYLHKAPMHRCVASVAYGKEEDQDASLEETPLEIVNFDATRRAKEEDSLGPPNGLSFQGGGPGGGNRTPGEERNAL